ncbi:MAG TPA: UDP-N-acetylmuramoyl-tripeptide--D-alanyl-D-alanine ligase [Phnomibacter sp.]|nr:UDP-N-acetylmuramoyl-tripeptide--D-alanyl-D-alanine ligase [Phnomibacter sp.]
MISIAELHQYFLQSTGAVTDTRKIQAGQIFFALKGPSFNGNAFAWQACQMGASYAVIDDPDYAISEKMLLVPDVLKALQELALYHRNTFKIPVLAITGSNGKTTTKELVHAVLSTTYTTYTTQGNLNNHIGVPLTLLSIKSDAEMAVIEMGANHQKEIESYCSFTAPTHGLVTNCGKAHLEGFGGIEGVRKGKGELFDYLRAHDGIAFAASDFDYFPSMVAGINTVHWYGTQTGNVTGHAIQSEPFLQVQIEKGFSQSKQVNTQLVGAYNIYNVLAAVAVGVHFGVPEEKIVYALESYLPTNSRSQLVEMNGNKIILDAYNANPSSMAVAIENFAGLHAENKMLLLGGMMELGETSRQEHQQLVALIQKYNWKEVVLVGGDFAHVDHPFRYFENATAAAAWWQQKACTNCYLLIKGSRSMQMEKIIQS